MQAVLNSYSLATVANVENLAFSGVGAFIGTGNALAVTGGSGNDTLDGGSAGNDILVGLLGDDTYLVDHTGVTIRENINEGNDTVETTLNSYSLASFVNVENLNFVGAGAFFGAGNALANTITGGLGNDVLDGGSAGTDVLVGSRGDDTYIVSHLGMTIAETLNEGTDTVQTTLGSYSLAGLTNVENLTFAGSGFTALNGVGNASDNVLTGGRGNDTLSGLGGIYTLIGGNGNDTAVFSGQAFNYAFSHDAVDNLMIADERSGAPDGADTVIGVENAQFGAHSFRLIVPASDFDGANTLNGTGGSDILLGFGGNDPLFASNGTDLMVGGAERLR